MGDVRVAALAQLAAVTLLGEVVAALQQPGVDLGVRAAVDREQRLEHRLDRRLRAASVTRRRASRSRTRRRWVAFGVRRAAAALVVGAAGSAGRRGDVSAGSADCGVGRASSIAGEAAGLGSAQVLRQPRRLSRARPVARCVTCRRSRLGVRRAARSAARARRARPGRPGSRARAARASASDRRRRPRAIRSAAARSVPPVASTSSTSSTRWPSSTSDRHLDLGRAVLEVVGAPHRRRRQLAGLAHRHESAAELAGDRAGEQEAAGLDAGDDVDVGRDARPARARTAAKAAASASSGVMSLNTMPGLREVRDVAQPRRDQPAARRRASPSRRLRLRRRAAAGRRACGAGAGRRCAGPDARARCPAAASSASSAARRASADRLATTRLVSALVLRRRAR